MLILPLAHEMCKIRKSEPSTWALTFPLSTAKPANQSDREFDEKCNRKEKLPSYCDPTKA